MARINREVITAAIIDATGARSGAADFDRAAAKVVSAANAMNRIIERQTILLGDQSKKFAALQRAIDPTYAASQKFAKGLDTLNAAFKGDRGSTEYLRLLGLLEAKYKDVGGASVKSAQSQADALDKMRARYDPLFAANQRYKKELRDLLEAHQAGAVDEPNFRREHARVEQEFNPASIAQRVQAKATAELDAANARAAEAAAAHARSVDALKAKYDPAFAATLKFRTALAELAHAEEMGALKGQALEAEIQHVFNTLSPAAVAAKKLADAQAGMAVAAQHAAEVAAQEAKALDLLRAKYDPVFAATMRYKDALTALNQAALDGAIRGRPLADALDKIERELNPLSIAAKKAAEAEAELQKRGQALRETLDPQLRAQRLYNEAIREAQELHWKGAIGLKEYEKATERAANALREVKSAANEAAHSEKERSRIFARRITQLSPQISDVVTQAFSGTPITQILVQQGPQIADIWGGIPTLIKAIPPPVYAAVAAFAVLGTVALATAGRMTEIARQTRELDSIGRTVNPQIQGMAANLRAMTIAMSEKGVSRADSMKALQELVRTRALSAELYGKINNIAPDVMGALQTNAPGAAKALAEGFSRGANGVRELDEKLHFLEPSQMRNIELLDKQGHRMEAMQLAMKQLTKIYESEGERQMSAWERMTTSIGNAWSALWEKIANSPQAQAFMRDWANVADMITRALKGTGAASVAAGTDIKATTEDIAALSAEIFRLQKEANAAQAEGFRLMDANDPGADAALEHAADLARQMQEAQAKLKALRAKGTPAPAPAPNAAPGAGTMTTLDSRGLTPDEQMRVDKSNDLYDEETKHLKANRIERQIAMAGYQAYAAVRARPENNSANEAEQARLLAEKAARRDLQITIDDENQALDLNRSMTDKVGEAYGRSTVEGLRMTAMRQAARDELTTGTDAAARAIRLLNQAASEAYVAGEQDLQRLKRDVANLRDIAAGARKGPVAEEQAKRVAEGEAAYRDKLDAAQAARDAAVTDADKTNADAKIENLKRLRDAYIDSAKGRDDANRAIASAAMYRAQYQDDLENVQLEAKLIGATVEQREKEVAAIKVKQALLAMGYEKDTQAYNDEFDRMKKIIDLREKAALKTRLQTEAHERNKQAALDSINIIQDGLDDWIHEGNQFIDVIRNIAKAFLKLGEDVLIMEPLKRWLTTMMDAKFYGTNGPNGSSGAMTGTQNVAAAGGGAASTISSLIQTGLNMWAGWNAGTGPSLMPNAASDPGALSGGALLENYKMFPVAHQGWHVGHEAPPAVRMAPTSVMINAPRLHSGGMRPGEYGAILERGEEVLSARSPRHRRNFQGSGHTVIMNITTPDANSFRQSQGQVTAAAARSLQMASRRNS